MYTRRAVRGEDGDWHRRAAGRPQCGKFPPGNYRRLPSPVHAEHLREGCAGRSDALIASGRDASGILCPGWISRRVDNRTRQQHQKPASNEQMAAPGDALRATQTCTAVPWNV